MTPSEIFLVAMLIVFSVPYLVWRLGRTDYLAPLVVVQILTGIALLDGNRLARIDTGISRYYGGPLSWLEIVGDRMIPHSIGRPAS